jgi:hypothetical protein
VPRRSLLRTGIIIIVDCDLLKVAVSPRRLLSCSGRAIIIIIIVDCDFPKVAVSCLAGHYSGRAIIIIFVCVDCRVTSPHHIS